MAQGEKASPIILVIPAAASACEKQELLRTAGLRGMALTVAKDELGLPLSPWEKSALATTPTGTRDNARALAQARLTQAVGRA